MSWRTNRIVLGLRSIGRVTGLNKLIVILLGSESYEDKFQSVMLGSIKPGDCVWDIGANVGMYTKKFSELVGDDGKVYAFEPSPINLEELKKEVKGQANIEIVPVALGDKEMVVSFQQGDDPIGATSKVLTDSVRSSNEIGIEVEMIPGDVLVTSGRAVLPNAIKIDTEGFELDVIKGLTNVINSMGMRTICVEVHFGLLHKRDMDDAPSQIEQILKKAGYKFSWPDSSHIVGERI